MTDYNRDTEVLNAALKLTSCKFLEWAISEGWERYVYDDRWIKPHESKKVLSTKELFDEFLKHRT